VITQWFLTLLRSRSDADGAARRVKAAGTSPSPLTKFLREDHESLCEALGSLAASLGGLDAGGTSTRNHLDGVARFVTVLDHHLETHCAREERVLAPALREKFPDLAESIHRVMSEHAGLRDGSRELGLALAAADRNELGAKRRVVSIGYGIGQALHCHVCEVERFLLDLADHMEPGDQKWLAAVLAAPLSARTEVS